MRKITLAELQDMFGETMPIEAFTLIANPGTLTPDQVRANLRAVLAASQTVVSHRCPQCRHPHALDATADVRWSPDTRKWEVWDEIESSVTCSLCGWDGPLEDTHFSERVWPSDKVPALRPQEPHVGETLVSAVREIIDNRAIEYLHPDDRQMLQEALARVEGDATPGSNEWLKGSPQYHPGDLA